jgi:LysR family transcriptional regulator, low CO2-responsive transcriptional regulator
MISLRQLSVFLEIARTGSIRAAAEALDVSQPAVSAAVAELQREIGASLLEREGRGVVLTEAGRTLERYGRRVMALLDESRIAVQEGAAGSSRARVASVTTAAESLLPPLLRGLHEREPGLRIELDVANRERIWDRLSHWEVELVIAGRPPLVPSCRTLAVRANHLVVVGPPGWRIDDDALASATWLLREPGSGTRAATEEIFALLGIQPPTLTIGSNGAIRECVRAGLGLSILSDDAVARDIADGRLLLVPTPVTPLRRNWHLVTNADRSLTVGAHRFLAYALESGIFVLTDDMDRM